MRALSDWRIPRTLSAFFIIACFIASVGFLSSSLVKPANQWIERAPSYIKKIEKKLSFIKKPIEKISNTTEKIEDLVSVGDEHGTGGTSTAELSLGREFFNVTSSAFAMFAATLVLLYFFLVYGDFLIARINPLFSDEGHNLISKIEKKISRYIGTITIINFFLGLSIAIAMWALSVPNPLLWGVLAGSLNFVPYIGQLIGIIIVALVSLVSFEMTWYVVFPSLIYFILNTIEGQVITPTLLGHQLKINPLVIFLTMYFSGWAWGLEGALISVPIVSIFKVVCDNVTGLNKYGKILEY